MIGTSPRCETCKRPLTTQLNYDWSCADYLAATGPSVLPSSHVVFVEVDCKPESRLQEVAWVQSLVDDPTCNITFEAIIGHASLEQANISHVLNIMRREAPLLRGIREVCLHLI
jgi:hypothetical protein